MRMKLPRCSTAGRSLLEANLFSSHDDDHAGGRFSIFVWIEICYILPSITHRDGPEGEIHCHLFLTAFSAWLPRQWVIEPDRYVFQNKVSCTMCAQLNNKTPVRIGRGMASCDMPSGCIQLLSLQSWLGWLLAHWAGGCFSRVTAVMLCLCNRNCV